MPFNAGELIATIRGDRTQLTRDLAAAKTDLGSVGPVADKTAARVTAAAAKEAAAQRTVSAAAKDVAAAQTAAGNAGATAGEKSVAGASRAAAGTREQAKAARGAGDAAASAGAAGKRAGEDTATAAKHAEAALDRQKSAAQTLGLGLTAYGAAAAGAFALTIRESSQYGAKVAQLRTLSGATADEMQRLSDAAQTQGTAYGFSASQVADAEIELQKAGQGVAQQLNGGLAGALTLAASGQLDVADATSIAVTTLTQFRLGADKTAHVADLLAAGSDKALGSVGDLGEALKQGGLVASQMGLSVEDTVGTLSAFAQAGLIGSDAGTSLKTMLLSLQSPSTQAQKYLDDLGISAYDTGGQFVGITNLAGQLQEKLKDKSQAERDAALSTIFGSDAIRSANVLYKEGAQGIQGWIGAVDDSGFAAEQAAGKQDSLAGDLQRLAAVIQTDLIRAGQALDPVLRPVAQTLGVIADAAGVLPPPLLGGAAAIAGLTGAVALGSGALLLFLPRLLEIRSASRVFQQEIAFATYGTDKFSGSARVATSVGGSMKRGLTGIAGFLGGPWGIALTVGTAALVAFNKAQEDTKASADTIDAAVKQTGDGLQLLQLGAQGKSVLQMLGIGPDADDVVRSFSVSVHDLGVQMGGSGELTKGLGSSQALIDATKSSLEQVGQALARVSSSDAPGAARAFDTLAKRTDGQRLTLRALLDSMPEYREALRAQAVAAGENVTQGTKAEQTDRLLAFAQKSVADSAKAGAGEAQGLASGVSEVDQAASDAKQQVDDLVDSIKGLDGGQLDARAASRKFQQAIDDATAALKDNGQTAIDHGRKLDISTEKGRANADALDDIAQSGLDAAAAYVAAGGDSAGASKRIEDARKAFVLAAGPKGMGLTRAAAKKLADDLLGIPGSIPVQVDVGIGGVSAVDAELNALQTKLNSLKVPNAAQIVKNARIGMASGGQVAGGIPGRDSVPILAMPGEHMLTVQDVGAMGGQSGVYSFRRALHGYAKGGAIKAPAAGSQAAYDAEAARLQAQIDKQEKAVKTARARAKAAESAYQKAQDAGASIYGKGTGDKKHDATMRTREAKAKADRLGKAQDAAEKRLDSLRGSLDKQQARSESAADLRTSISRGGFDSDSPFAAVDLAFQESRDMNLTGAQRKALRNTAQRQNGLLVGLDKQAKDAATAIDSTSSALDNARQATQQAEEAYHHQQTAVEKATTAVQDATTAQANAVSSLQSLRDQFTSVVSSVGSNIRGLFSLSNAIREDEVKTTALVHNAGTGAEWSEMVTSTTAGGATVQSIRSEIDQKAATFSSFAGQLQQLSAMGYSSDVVTDVANLGADAGAKVAAALLVAGQDDVRAINGGYSSIAASTAAAGTTVAQGQLGGQISDAQRAVDVANANLATAQAQLTQAQDADLAQLRATQAAAQQAYDVAVANRDSINRQIDSAQSAIVKAVQASLAGTTKKALGGISHAAQIQGSPVLWAEAGEEAYIPLANDARRPRALAILDETARRLGVAVVPQGTARMALGGISSSSSTSYGGDTHNWNGPILGDPATLMAAARRDAAKQRARANSAARIGRVQP